MYPYQVDLHYHAGGERIEGKTLGDYVAYARRTGRKILGVTDHLESFFPPRNGLRGPYEQSLAGLVRLRGDVDGLKGDFPDMQLFLGPEMGFKFEHIEDKMAELSDYFICEPVPFRGDKAENTALFIAALEKAARVRRQTGRPTVLAHPFRSQLYHRYDTGSFGPPVPPDIEDIGEEEAGDFLGTDLAAFASASRELGVPIEVNGVTLANARALNHPYLAAVLKAAYLSLHRLGAPFSIGSDQHYTNVGGGAAPVPGEVFDLVGATAADIPTLALIGARV